MTSSSGCSARRGGVGFKTTRVNPIEVEDCAVASLLMADGSLVSLSATLGSARQVDAPALLLRERHVREARAR